MRNKRIGNRTMKMENSPTIISTASIVGPKEGKGPLKDKFDVILQDDLYGEKTWELAERDVYKRQGNSSYFIFNRFCVDI